MPVKTPLLLELVPVLAKALPSSGRVKEPELKKPPEESQGYEPQRALQGGLLLPVLALSVEAQICESRQGWKEPPPEQEAAFSVQNEATFLPFDLKAVAEAA